MSNERSMSGIAFFFAGGGKGKKIAIVRTFAILVFWLFSMINISFLLYPDVANRSLGSGHPLAQANLQLLVLFSSLSLYVLGIRLTEKNQNNRKADLLRMVAIMYYTLTVFYIQGGIAGPGVIWIPACILGIFWATENVKLVAIISLVLIGSASYWYSQGHAGANAFEMLHFANGVFLNFFVGVLFQKRSNEDRIKIESARDAAVQAKNQAEKMRLELQTILTTLPSALFKIGADGKILSADGNHLNLLGLQADASAIQDIDSLFYQLTEVTRDQIETSLGLLRHLPGSIDLEFEANLSSLLKEACYKGRWLSFDYGMNCDADGNIEFILLVISDASAKKSAEASARLNTLYAIFLQHMKSGRLAKTLLAAKQSSLTIEQLIERSLTEDKILIARDLHTLKGNFRTLGLGELASFVHDFETELKRGDLDHHALMNLAHSLSSKIQEISDLHEKVIPLGVDQVILPKNELLKAYHQNTLAEFAIRYTHYRLEDMLRSHEVVFEKRALGQHKLAPDLVIEAEEMFVTEAAMTKLDAIFLHCLGNAIDHGVETVAERLQKGKPERATITVRAKKVAQRICIDITDNGGGLHLEKIKTKALEKGFIAADLSKDKIADLIFQAGFSTKESVDELSGRGVGMDIVRSTAEELGGKAEAVLHAESRSSSESRVPWTLHLEFAAKHFFLFEATDQKLKQLAS